MGYHAQVGTPGFLGSVAPSSGTSPDQRGISPPVGHATPGDHEHVEYSTDPLVPVVTFPIIDEE